MGVATELCGWQQCSDVSGPYDKVRLILYHLNIYLKSYAYFRLLLGILALRERWEKLRHQFTLAVVKELVPQELH